jgi:hypothetical protein
MVQSRQSIWQSRYLAIRTTCIAAISRTLIEGTLAHIMLSELKPACHNDLCLARFQNTDYKDTFWRR